MPFCLDSHWSVGFGMAKGVLSNTFFFRGRGEPLPLSTREKREPSKTSAPPPEKEGEGEDILQRGGIQLGWYLRASE